MASLTGVLAAVDVHTSRQGHGWADATLVNVSAAGPSGASWPTSVPLLVPPRAYATVADWLAAGVSVAVLVRADCRGDKPELTVVDIRQPDGDGIPPAPFPCGQPATRAVLAYPIPYGLRIHTHFTCSDHFEAAVARVEAAGMHPEHGPGIRPVWGSRCGDVVGRDGGEPAPVECDQPKGDTGPGRCGHCGGPLTVDGRCFITILNREAAHADRALESMEAAARRAEARQGGEVR